MKTDMSSHSGPLSPDEGALVFYLLYIRIFAKTFCFSRCRDSGLLRSAAAW